MADLLTDEERDALKDSIQQTAQSPKSTLPKLPEPTPVALIADDKATERVKPAALRIAERWCEALCRLVPPVTGAKIKVEIDDTVQNHTSEIVEELAHSWLGQVLPGHGRGSFLISASGKMVPELAAMILGGKYTAEDKTKPTTATLRVFGKIGHQIVVGLVRALQQEQGGEPKSVPPPKSAETWTPFADELPVIMVRLSVTGDVEGTVRFVSPPDALAVPRQLPNAPQTDPALARAVLADVPVELSVELGSTTMRAQEFSSLEPGAVLSLDSLIGDPLPVRVGGRLHAFGHAVLMGDVIAVEIANPAVMAGLHEEAA